MSKREVDEWFWTVGAELSRLAEEIGPTRTRIAARRSWEPRIDLLDDGEKIIVRAEIAGVRGEDVQLLFLADRNTLVIRGHRPEQSMADAERVQAYQLEIFYGPFEREIVLPDGEIDPDRIRAQYRNGILYVLIPR